MKKCIAPLEAQERALFSRRFRFLYNRWRTEEKAAGRRPSQGELAEHLHCNKNSITQYMNQQATPTYYSLAKICEFFDVTPEFFSTPIFDCDNPNYVDNRQKQSNTSNDIVARYLVDHSFVDFIATEFFEDDLPNWGEIRTCPGVDTEFSIPGRNNTSYALCSSDLMFLAQLQNEVIDYIQYRFFREKERLKADTIVKNSKKNLSGYNKDTRSFSILANKEHVRQLYDFAMLLGKRPNDFLIMLKTGEAEQIFEEYTSCWEE